MVPVDELEGHHKRSRYRRPAIAVVVIAAAVVGAFLLRPREPALTTGGRAPAFDLPLLDGSGTLSSEDLEGTPVVLNLWASWCGPCREEAPVFERMYNKYKGRVVFVGVNVRDVEPAARDFVEQFGITYPVVVDEQRKLARALDHFGLPETFFLDDEWRFVGTGQGERIENARDTVVLGALSEEELERSVRALLEAREDQGS
jgi:cytochrome c biogenesis protein CcmG/thiol:disulfide interchange protein DsbE